MRIIFSVIMFVSTVVFGQGIDIIPCLKAIDRGDIAEANQFLDSYRKKAPNCIEVDFLSALLTENASEAVAKYSYVYEKNKKFKFADLCLYRLFSYYYSIGSYNKATVFLNKLKNEYPSSPYIKATNRKIPDIDEKLVPISRTEPIKKAPEKIIAKQIFAIQAGAFHNKQNASNLVSKFESRGWSAESFVKNVGGTDLNIVMVGEFQSKSEAEKVLSALKKEFNLLGRIVEK